MQRWRDLEVRMEHLRKLLTEASRELQTLEQGFAEVSASVEVMSREDVETVQQDAKFTRSKAVNPISRRRRRRFTSLAEAFPQTALLWDMERNGGLSPEHIAKSSSRRVWWRCPKCGQAWEASVLSQTTRKYACPHCARPVRQQPDYDFAPRRPSETLADSFPKLAAEWHPALNGELTPNMISPRAHTKAWWICSSCGFEFSARVVNRTIGTRCPNCLQLTTT